MGSQEGLESEEEEIAGVLRLEKWRDAERQ